VTVRASRSAGALVIRAKAAGEDWQLVRVCPEPAGGTLLTGPNCCAPTLDGVVVTFTSVAYTPPDPALHPP